MSKVFKLFFAFLLCGVSVSSFAHFVQLQSSATDSTVLTVNYTYPPSKTSYAEFVLNGHVLGVNPIDGGDSAMYLGNKGVTRLVRAGYLNLNQKNTFDFYQCTTETCVSSKPAQQTAHHVVIKLVAPHVYAATPNVIGVTLK